MTSKTAGKYTSLRTRAIQVASFVFGFVSVALSSHRAPPRVEFSNDVLPILQAHCTRCHDTDQKSGGLVLSARSSVLFGGDSGKIVTPGRSADSLLVKRIEGVNGAVRMPLGFGPLSDKDIAVIRAWIDQGCLDSNGPKKTHWAYVKPVRPKVPSVQNGGWVRNAIDAFVLARLEKEGLKPSPEADKVTLVRRLSLDLIGLPPTPSEVDAFLADRSPNAYEKVVDRLLASPHFGERMALPWLDAARYADSNGFQQDGDTFQYVWRDWVVRALNSNMPFDRFTIEQLAGDLLPNTDRSTPEGRDRLIATAFNRNHMLNGEGGAIPEEQRNINLFDRVETTSTTWLGLTMTCTRCHDHKYDPLTQKDYFSFMAFFNKVPETGVPSGEGQYRIGEPWIYAGSSGQMLQLRKLDMELSEKKLLLTAKPDPHLTAEIKTTQNQLDGLTATIPRVMIMADRDPRKTYIYSRGNYTSPLAEVKAATPAVLPPMPSGVPNDRLALARWIVSPENPLTARVQVNRYWQTLLGRGLVRTPENFGVQGEPPTHPELLDWLAVEFRESGWNVKRLLRMIVTSATYRQNSKVSKALAERDPDNRLLARGARFRMPSLLLRDMALAASGLLNPAIGGKPVYPYQPKGIWDGLSITEERDFTYPQSKGQDLYRRSIYTFWRRTVAPGDMFDSATRQICTVRFSQTSTPLHALTTLNDVAWVEAGRALAESVMKSGATPSVRLSEAFRRVCARRPTVRELAILQRSLDRGLRYYAGNAPAAQEFLGQGSRKPDPSLDKTELAAYANVCLSILNLDEALSRE
jgi:hypothetical protein